MLKIHALCLTAFAAWGLLPLCAVGETLNWQSCINEAKTHNRALLVAEHNFKAAQYAIDSAKSSYYPQISVGAGASRSSSGDFSGELLSSTHDESAFAASSGGVRTSTSADITLSQNIFSGFKTEAEVEIAQASSQISAAELEITKAQVSFDLKSAYSTLAYGQSYVQLAQDIIKRREENLALVELRYQNGNENKGSYLLSRASLEDARLSSLQAENIIESSRQALAAVLGREISEDLEVMQDLPVSIPPLKPPFEELLSGMPQDRKAVAQKKLADARLKAADSSYLPSLDATGQNSYRDQSIGTAGKDSWQLGLQLSYPLFTGGRDYYQRKSAQEEVSAAVSQRIGTAHELRSQLKAAWTAYREAARRVEVNRTFVEAAASRAEIARARYNNGLLSFEDWDVIENDLIARQKNLLLSERDRVVAEAAWEQAQGKGVFQ